MWIASDDSERFINMANVCHFFFNYAEDGVEVHARMTNDRTVYIGLRQDGEEAVKSVKGLCTLDSNLGTGS